jgi:glutamate carboxypeptidase
MPLDQEIQQYLHSHLDEYLDILHQMVAINSFTANPEGVNRLGKLTADLFAVLGFQAEFVQSEHRNYGQHLFLSRAGPAVEGAAAPNCVAMISHLDTVYSPEEEIKNNFTWRPEGERIYGPGTVDIKGGTVMIYMVLDALRTFVPGVFDGVSWKVFLNASEEALSHDFTHLCLARLPKDCRACLVFEGGTISGEAFPLVTARKGRATFRVVVEGKSAHAGNYHSYGANAIVQLAHTVQKIAALTDYKRGLTFNVGTISGGTVVNRVPHHAEAEVEMRAFLPEVFENGVSRMLELGRTSEVISKDGFRCKVRVEAREKTAPWPDNLATRRLFQVWQTAAERLGLNVVQEERGGLSDGNMLWRHYPTLDGLGPAGNNAHCSERSPDGSKDQEFVLVSSFVPKALLNIFGILRLLEAL